MEARRRRIVGSAGFLIAVAATAAAAHAAAEGPLKIAGDPPGVDLGEGLVLGTAVQAECATVWPVFARVEPADVGDDFVSLPDAQAAGLAEVRETGAVGAARDRAQNTYEGDDMGGTVNTLVVENRGDKPILVLAGTLLKGGKQDRQVGQDFIVPPRAVVAADAFCVEHGRWVASREGVATGGSFEAKKSLATKSVRKKAQYEGDQSGVWDEVAKENARAGKAPSSGTLLATVEDADAEAARRRASVEKAIRGALAAERSAGRRPVGLAYAVAGAVREVRVFTHPRIFDRFEETLVATIALEDLQGFRSRAGKGSSASCRPGDVAKVVALVQGASREEAKARARKIQTKAGSVNELRDLGDVLSTECLPSADSKKGVTKSFMYAE